MADQAKTTTSAHRCRSADLPPRSALRPELAAFYARRQQPVPFRREQERGILAELALGQGTD